MPSLRSAKGKEEVEEVPLPPKNSGGLPSTLLGSARVAAEAVVIEGGARAKKSKAEPKAKSKAKSTATSSDAGPDEDVDPFGPDDPANGIADTDLYPFMMATIRANGGLAGFVIDGMDQFYEGGCRQIIEGSFHQTSTVPGPEGTDVREVRFEIMFRDVDIRRPYIEHAAAGVTSPLYPRDARRNGIPYAGDLVFRTLFKMTLRLTDGTERLIEGEVPLLPIGKIPIMVKSNRCWTHNLPAAALEALGEDPTDPGGYFIVQGGNEMIGENRENVPFNRDVYYLVTSKKEKTRETGRRARAEIISQAGGPFENSSQLKAELTANGGIELSFQAPEIEDARVPFWVLFRVLGMVRDRDIAETIAYDISPTADPINTQIHETVVRALRVTRVSASSGHDFAPIADELDPGAIARFLADRVLKASSHRRKQGPARRVTPANEAARAQAVADTQAEESRRIRADLLGVLDYNILPHLGRSEADRGAKLQYMGRMLHNMCLVHFDVRAPTDRDNLAGKRVHGPGLSFSKVFKTFFGKEIALPLRRWINRTIDTIRDPNSLTASAVAEGLQARLNGAQKFERTLADLFTSKEEIRTSSGPPVKKRFSAKALERKNQANVIELIRNVCASSANKANKQNERADFMRRVHASFAFFICILKSADTGEDVGIKKSLALMSTVTSADETALPVATIGACAAEMASVFAEYAAAGGGPDGDIPQWPYGPTWETLPEPEQPYGLAPIRSFSNATAASRGLSIARVDGEPVAWTDNHLALANHLRAIRRAGTGGLGPKATVMHDPVTREVDVWVNAGRFVAPFLVVEDNAMERRAARRRGETPPPFRRRLLATPEDLAALQAGAATLEDLRRRGVVEWLTPGEVATGAIIAPGLEALREAGHDPAAPRYTHLGPAQALLGLAGLTSPYTGHTQPVRGTYQTNHGRAAGGWATLVPEGTPRKHTFNMFFCEHPMVGTFANRLTRPNGINVTVAYCVRGGASIEDGAVMSRGFQSRGGFVGAWFDGVRVVADRAAGEEFGPPPAAITANPRSANYALLGPAGHVETGTFVEPGDVLVGLHAPAEAGRSGGAIRVDRSAVYKGSERALVEEAYRGHGAAGDPFVYIRLRKTRPAGRGNKYSSRQGNKAIVGMCVNDEDMPYDERGISPDMLINPHSVPSRMITGQMIEALTCLYCRATGTTADATAFLATDVAAIQNAIMALAPVAALSDGEPLGRVGGPLDVAADGNALPAQLDEAAAEMYRRAASVFESTTGLRHSGLTRLYDGRTGRPLDAAIFQSQTYYQLIQKFGVDNAYATSKAPTDALTGQPLSGKAARGGHRISELQAWVNAAQGAMGIMGEIFYNRSDATITNVCRSCGGDGAYDTALGLYRCISCGKKTTLAGVDTCQTTNVFRKIVRSAGVDIRLHPRPLEFPEPVPDALYS